MSTPAGYVKTGYVTASLNPGASSVPVYKKTTGSYAKFYAVSGGQVGNPVGQESLVKNASGTVKKLGAFLKANKKAKAPSPAKAKSPAKSPAKAPAKAKSPNFSVGYTNTGLKTLEGYKVYKDPLTKKYYYSYPDSMVKHVLPNMKLIEKPNGSLIMFKNLPSSPSNSKSPPSVNNFNQNNNSGVYYYKGTKNAVPIETMVKKSNGSMTTIGQMQIAHINKKIANMNTKAVSPNKNTGFFTATGHPVMMKNSNAYYKPHPHGNWVPLKSKDAILYKTKSGGKVGTLVNYLKDPTAFAVKAKTPTNAMTGYNKTNLKVGSLPVYKKNGDYFYKKENGQPQKLGHAVKVTKPNGKIFHLKMLNYNKTNLKFGNKNVYKKNDSYYTTNIYSSNKPTKLSANQIITKQNGSSVKIGNITDVGMYQRLTGMVTQVDKPVYYRIETSNKVRFYYKSSDTYHHINSATVIFKDSDKTHVNPIPIEDYFLHSTNVYTNTGMKSNGKMVYKHKYMPNKVAVKNGNKYSFKFKGKKGIEKSLGIVKPKTKYIPPAPASAPVPAILPGTLTTAPVPAIVSVSLVPVVKPGPDHVQAKVSDYTKAVDRVAQKMKELQEVTESGNNKNIPACPAQNGYAYMERQNNLKYRYSKIPNLSGNWKSILSKPKFDYATYEHKLTYTQYLAHKQLLFRYGRNMNSFENLRVSTMMDMKWFAAQDKYIRSLSSRDIMTISGYTYNGDSWAHAYLDGRFDYTQFKNSVKNLYTTYFAFFFQARDFYKINTGDMNKDYDETVKRVSSETDNDNIKSIIHMFINDLNEIIRKSPTVNRSFVLFRGNKDDKYLSGAVNNTYTTERFCSASVSGDVARERFSGGHELQRITVLKGSKCLLIFGVTQVPGEWEILLPRGSTYQIIKRRQNMEANTSTNLCSPSHYKQKVRYLSDVVLLGTPEDIKKVEAVPVEIQPATNAHVMQKYIKNWPVKITGILGQGGMGAVYQGITNNGKNVAVKFQKKSTNSNAEKASLKKLAGLNVIPKLIRNKNLNANNYLASTIPKVKSGNKMNVMESTLIKGQALKKWYTGAPIPKEIANKVKNSISKIHSRGVIHGNLHRDNIIIGNNGRAYIIDFGRSIITNKPFSTPQNANNKLRTLGPLSKKHNKNIVTGPNGRFHFFNGNFLKKMKVAA